jgi:hypothetical protein
MSGLLLPGILSVTLDEAIGVGIPALKNGLIYDVLMYDVVTIARTKVDGNVSFTNFIETELDINKKISYIASAEGKNADDAYALEVINITMNASVNPKYSLPSASGVLVNAGSIEAQAPDSELLGIFPVTLTVNCDAAGVMTSNIAISGHDVAAKAIDNPNQAQKTYWSGSQLKPSVAADDADILTTKISSAELTNTYANELNLINNQYNNQNMIQSWTIKINAINSSTDNPLAQHARFLEKKGNTSVFSEGQKMVASAPFPYGISISDYLGNDTIIIQSTNVFGVVSHKSSDL